jgi:hypothetical protein
LRLVWRAQALEQLEHLAARAPVQAAAVVQAAEWLADVGYSLGRSVPGDAGLYWPVPPQGFYYRVNRDRTELVITAVKDARRRRRPW